MNGIVFILFLIINVVQASIDERNDGRSRGEFIAVKRSYWEAQREEAEEKKRKKFRLGSAANKESSGANKRQLTPVKTSMLEDKMRLSYDPVVYKAEKNLHFAQHEERLQLVSQVRQPDFMSHH